MAEVGVVYLCVICGNKVKVLEAGDGELVCCGEAMAEVFGE
jgi:desulfoferrodoxin-like iron-binding protein